MAASIALLIAWSELEGNVGEMLLIVLLVRIFLCT